MRWLKSLVLYWLHWSSQCCAAMHRCDSKLDQDISTVKYIYSIFYIFILEQIMTSKANWACANCGMFSSRKASVKRHITNLHHGQGVLLSYIDYVVGRQRGFYVLAAPRLLSTMTSLNLCLLRQKCVMSSRRNYGGNLLERLSEGGKTPVRPAWIIFATHK